MGLPVWQRFNQCVQIRRQIYFKTFSPTHSQEKGKKKSTLSVLFLTFFFSIHSVQSIRLPLCGRFKKTGCFVLRIKCIQNKVYIRTHVHTLQRISFMINFFLRSFRHGTWVETIAANAQSVLPLSLLHSLLIWVVKWSSKWRKWRNSDTVKVMSMYFTIILNALHNGTKFNIILKIVLDVRATFGLSFFVLFMWNCLKFAYCCRCWQLLL